MIADEAAPHELLNEAAQLVVQAKDRMLSGSTLDRLLDAMSEMLYVLSIDVEEGRR